MNARSQASEDGAKESRPPLFRPEVSERDWVMLASRGLLPQPPRFASLVIAVLLAAFGLAAILFYRGTIARAEVAPGYLEPASGVARVRAPRQGIIGAVHVRDGQLVSLGDALVTLRSDEITESGAAAAQQITVQLESQKQDLTAQIERERGWRQSEEHRLALVVDGMSQDLDMLDGAIRIQQDQVVLADNNADRIRDLVRRGTVALEELQRREIDALDHRLAVQNAEREKSSKRVQLAAARIALEQLPTTASERLRSLRDALANVQQRLIEIDAKRAVTIRAPVTGRVEIAPALSGATVDGNSLIATVVPENMALRARLFVPTSGIGKIHAGQTVRIRYDAFPFQKYGTFDGHIEDVSRSVLLPSEVARIAPVKLAAPAYVVDVAIQRQSVALGEGQQAALRPDMLLTAMIQLDRRPLLAWISDSLFGVGQN